MEKRNIAWQITAVLLASVFLAACNLGQQIPTEPLATEPVVIATEDTGLGPQIEEGITPTGVVVPATLTPVPDLLPKETLGPIAVQGADHRVDDAIKIVVRRGSEVANVTCTAVLQETGTPATLAAPSSAAADADTFNDTYTFTPTSAGTYSVSCTGIANTATGPRAVNDSGSPFTVEAKG